MKQPSALRSDRLLSATFLLIASLFLQRALTAQTTTAVPMPPLANYITTPGTGLLLADYRLTVGDLDGNGVPDLVFSNAVAYLTVYLMAMSSGQLSVLSQETILDWPLACELTGDRARRLTTSPWGIDTPLIYDIDLDGINELIYLKHLSSPSGIGEIQLAIYEYETASTSFIEQPTSLHPVTPTDGHNLAGGAGLLGSSYFSTSCGVQKEGTNAINMRIANLRGLAFPQDILIWGTSQSEINTLIAYAYDTGGGNPMLTRIFTHDTWCQQTSVDPFSGVRGHNWRSIDIDFDGKDEVIGRHVISYDESANPPNQVRWGIATTSIDECCSGTNNHPDHVDALDFLTSYVDEVTGKTIPAPGIEVIAGIDASNASGCPVDHSGPWIYRGVTGHVVSGTDRPWPRRILNLDKTGEGGKYWWASTSTQIAQPVSSGANPSQWDDLLSSIYGEFSIKDPDIQVVLPGDLVYDTSTGGPDLHPGPELLALANSTNLVEPGCGGGGHVFYLFDSTDSLSALSWGEEGSNPNERVPAGREAALIDWIDDRQQVEVHSVNGVNCGTIALEVFAFEPNIGQKRYKAVSKFQNLIPAFGAEHFGDGSDGSVGVDMIGDSREELLYFALGNQVGDKYTSTELRMVEGPALSPGVTRAEPSPWKFLEYRLRSSNGLGYSQYINYKKFSGLRFTTSHLPRGRTGNQYGRIQDLKLVGGLPIAAHSGTAIVAEGGIPPYSYEITTGALPAGLSFTALSVAPGDNQVFWIHGVPSELGTSRFTLKVTDSAVTAKEYSQQFWLAVDVWGGIAQQNSAPRIVSAGFDGTYAVAGVTTNVPIEAMITDINGQGNIVAARVFDMNDSPVAVLSDPNGDGVWTGTINVAGMAVGDARQYKIVASDRQGHTSLHWPFLVIDGGPGKTRPPFQPVSPVPSSQANTPTIDRVEIISHTIEPGEISDAPDRRVIAKIYVKDNKGNGVVRVDAVIWNHSSPDKTYSDSFVPSNPNASTFTITVPHPSNPGLPSAEFGWGYHSLNIRITTKDGALVEWPSDWWPQLVAHSNQ